MGIDAVTAATLMSNSPSQVLKAASRLSLLHRAQPMTDAQINAVAKDFESMFIAQMMEPMFGESTGSELFGDKDTQEIYKGLMMEEYGKQIAASGGIGIASYVRKELLALQEVL